MKKGIIIAAIAAVITAGSVFVVNKTSHSNEDDIIIANIEALQYEELPDGTIFHCEDGFCIIFGYENNFVGGCKKNEAYICKVQQTNFPNL